MEQLASLGITVEEDRVKIFQEIHPELDFSSGNVDSIKPSGATSAYRYVQTIKITYDLFCESLVLMILWPI